MAAYYERVLPNLFLDDSHVPALPTQISCSKFFKVAIRSKAVRKPTKNFSEGRRLKLTKVDSFQWAIPFYIHTGGWM